MTMCGAKKQQFANHEVVVATSDVKFVTKGLSCYVCVCVCVCHSYELYMGMLP